MPPELTALTLAGLLQAVLFALYAIPANLELTPQYTTSPRDTPPPRPLSTRTARLQRALANSHDSLILFTLATLVLSLSQQSTPLTQTAAWIYLAARLLYIPAYAFGLAPWRSLIWGIGFGATLTMMIAALL
jgi:uncharacterized MAPEG superfamily protein